MLIGISVVESGGEENSELTSLFRWLEEDLGPDGQLTLRRRHTPGAQGGVFDTINALIGEGVGIGGLALSYATWRQARRSPVKISFERDGVSVVVEDASPETLRRIADALAEPGSPAVGGSAATDQPGDPSPNTPKPARTQ
jgi:hypothetical protein